jgi:hypothetical protein
MVKSAPVTEEEIVEALEGDGQTTVTEDIYNATESKKSDPEDSGTIEHTTYKTVRVFKKLNNGHWTPRDIPRKNLPMVLRNGWKVSCPECGERDCTGKPNECSGNMGIKFRRCPQCGKTIYDDPVAFGATFQADSEDENEVVDDAYLEASPATRTKALLDRHILAYHPAEAAFLGVAVTDPRGNDGRRT